MIMKKLQSLCLRAGVSISNTLRLLTLPPDVVAMIEEGTLTAGQARPLIGLSNATNIAEEVVAKNLSARSVEMLVRAKAPQKSGQIRIDSNILNAQNSIEENLGLRVSIINKKNNTGKVTISYENLEQFELISNLLRALADTILLSSF